MPSFRSAYSPQVKVELNCVSPGRTKQSFKAECDINTIMKRYQTSGVLQSLAQGQPRYIDTRWVDFTVAMQTVADAKSLFEGLPAEVRARFGNDPKRLVEFAEDPNNDAELAKIGLRRVLPGGELPPQPESAPGAPAAPAAPLKA